MTSTLFRSTRAVTVCLALLPFGNCACPTGENDCIDPVTTGRYAGLAAQATRSTDGHVLALTFDREAGARTFTARVVVTDADGVPAPSLDVTVAASAGSVGTVAFAADAYTALVTPGAEAVEIDVTATVSVNGETLRATRTALALLQVDDRWGQPRAVEGLVNTCGWEDSMAVSPDGRWLFVQYLPIAIDCIVRGAGFACDTARGPVDAPFRPGMPGASRVDADGHIRHACPSLGIEWMPIAVPPNSLYGFRRQEDGSWADPFTIGFSGTDGCFSAYGPSFIPTGPNAGRLFFSFDESGAPESLARFADVTLGAPVDLGRFKRTDGDPFMAEDNTTLLDIGTELPTQSNPHAVAVDGQTLAGGPRVDVLFHDDEGHSTDIYVSMRSGDEPGRGWGPSRRIGTPVSTDEPESMPFFERETQQLIFMRAGAIVSNQFHGADDTALGDAASYDAARPLLVPDGASSEVGAIIVLGEPTIAHVDGHAELHFIYVIRRADGTLDLNAGVVEERESTL